MMELEEKSKTYWTKNNEWFVKLYTDASFWDRHFRKDVFLRMAVATRVCEEVGHARVLDIGCGSGHVMKHLVFAAKADHVTGVDFSRSMLRVAREVIATAGVQDKVTFIEGEATKYDFGSERFDVVIALGVFDYVREAQELWNRMVMLSRKLVVASFPGRQFPRSFLRYWRYRLRGCPVYFYRGGDVRVMVSGQRDIDVDIIGGQAGYVVVARKH